MFTIEPDRCRTITGVDQPGRADRVQEIDLHAAVPVLVGEIEQRRPRPVPGGVHEHVDPPPALERAVDEPFQVVVGLVRPGDAEPAQLSGQRLALAGGG